VGSKEFIIHEPVGGCSGTLLLSMSIIIIVWHWNTHSNLVISTFRAQTQTKTATVIIQVIQLTAFVAFNAILSLF
jgi:hypothetical protein